MKPRGDGEGRDRQFERQGTTAEDRESGEGFGPEGFRADGYPGRNPLRSESADERARAREFVWAWPQPPPEARGLRSRGSRSDERICIEIGRRLARAEPDLRCITVHVLDGRVTIRGSVAALEDAQVVEGVAGGVQGVDEVRSEIEVHRGEG